MKARVFKFWAFILTCVSTVVFMMVALASVTAAKFTETKKTTQSAFGLGGEKEVSIYFNANVWKQGKDSSGNIVDAAYYLYVWYNNGATDSKQATLIPSVHVTPTIGEVVMDLYVFEFDKYNLNRMIFLRWDPSKAPSTVLDSAHGLWNKTVDLIYSDSINYYCIDDWGIGDPKVATPNNNRIVKDNSGLHWAS